MLWCCLPAADRVLWLSVRRYGVGCCSMPCFGVDEVERGIHCGAACDGCRLSSCVCGHSGEAPSRRRRIVAPRGLRRAALQPARSSLRPAVDYFHLNAILERDKRAVWSLASTRENRDGRVESHSGCETG